MLLSYPADPNDLLLSGALVGGEALAGRPALVDVSLGKGHVVLFGVRPFWRNQTSGSHFLAFNAILNWNDLSAVRTIVSRFLRRGVGTDDRQSALTIVSRFLR